MLKWISVIPILAAIISAGVGLYFIYLYYKGARRRSELTFGITSLAIFVYAVASAVTYESPKIESVHLAQQLSIISMVIFAIFYFEYLANFTNKQVLHWITELLRIIGIFVVLVQLTITSDLTWRLEDTYLRKISIFGATYEFLQLQSGILTSIAFGIGLVVFCAAIWIVLDARKRLHWKFNHPILISTFLIFIALTNDVLVASGLYDFFYILELAFLFTVTYLTLMMSNSVVEAASARDKLEQLNLELEINHRQLEQKVDERTQELQYQAEYFRSLFENSPIAIVTLDNNQRIIQCNKAFNILFGYDTEEILHKDLDAIIAAPSVIDEARALSLKVLNKEKVIATGQRKRKDGSMVHVAISAVPVIVEKNKVGVLGLYQDISATLEADRVIRESEARYRSLFEDSPISLWEEDYSEVKRQIKVLEQSSGKQLEELVRNDYDIVRNLVQAIRIVNVNQATVQLFRAKDKQNLLLGINRIIPDRALPVLANEFICVSKGSLTFFNEVEQLDFEGNTIHVMLRFSVAPGFEDSWSKVFVSVQDITDRKNYEQKLEYLSTHDQLTGLANRALLYIQLKNAIARSHRENVSSAVLFLDLDGFKGINDQYGHEVGNQVLVEVSQRLQGTLRETDTIARMGGDEFVVIIENLKEEDTVLSVAEKVLEAIAAPFVFGEISCGVTASIGISLYPEDGLNPDQLVQQADMAMYQSKQMGKNMVSLFRQQADSTII